MGGIIGSSIGSNDTIQYCINAGWVYGSQSNSTVGGIIGKVQTTSATRIISSFNTGVIEGNASLSGAIVGYNQSSTISISNCHFNRQYTLLDGYGSQTHSPITGITARTHSDMLMPLSSTLGTTYFASGVNDRFPRHSNTFVNNHPASDVASSAMAFI